MQDSFHFNSTDIIEKDSLDVKLKAGDPLRIKFGADPTKPDLHLGHAVPIFALKQLQDLGHKIVFLIGDFTAKIGDPSGRDTTRPVLTDEEIEANAKTYLDQVGKILDLDRCEIRSNSEWYSKMNFADILKIASNATVAQITEREDFQKRLKSGQDVGLHEILYPLMQGYDSVELKADVEVGGHDQLLNMLMGRSLQKKMGQAPQDVITFPLLVGTDGKRKMSKSLDNYIAFQDSPENMFGKLMSITDEAIDQYIDLLTTFPQEEKDQLKKSLKDGENPKIVKELVAENITSTFHSTEEAVRAKEYFVRTIVNKEIPEEIDTYYFETENGEKLVKILVDSQIASSNSDATRLIKSGGVSIDSNKVDDINFEVKTSGAIIKVGKRRYVKVMNKND